MRRFWWLVMIFVPGLGFVWVPLRADAYVEVKIELGEGGGIDAPPDGDHTEQGDMRVLEPSPCIDC